MGVRAIALETGIRYLDIQFGHKHRIKKQNKKKRYYIMRVKKNEKIKKRTTNIKENKEKELD